MTREEQQKAAAEMDGCQIISTGFSDLACTRLNFGYAKQYNDYNSIIPLIQKCCTTKERWYLFIEELQRATVKQHCNDYFKLVFSSTPAQLREALLKAAGKWKD